MPVELPVSSPLVARKTTDRRGRAPLRLSSISALQLRDGDALHVEGAAAVDPGRIDGAAERRIDPLLRVADGVDVDVVVEDQRLIALARQHGDQVGLALRPCR